jgi:hypothetical protein
MTDQPLTYRLRPRPFGHEVSFRLDERSLFVDSGRRQEAIPYARVAALRLSYEPANVSWSAFRTKLTLTDGRTLRFGNLSWKSYVEAARNDAEYRRFVGALVDKVRAANPRVTCVAGKPAMLWGAVLAAGALMIAALAAVGCVAALRQAWGAAGLSAMFLVPLAWQVQAMATRNRPRRFTDQPPAGVMPPLPAGSR